MPHGGMGKHQSASMDSDVWLTPPDILEKLGRFDLDPCACSDPRPWETASVHYTREDNGLMKPWHGRVWMNPPYGRAIGKWIKKAYEASHLNWQHTGATVVCLIPARTDTRWWHDYCVKGEITFIKGRLKFVNRAFPSWKADGSHKISPAPFPSAIVVFKPSKGLGDNNG